MRLLTVFQIADILGEPPHRCEYVIRKYRLKPRRRVGITRLFDEAQVEAIEQGLYGIQVKGGRR